MKYNNRTLRSKKYEEKMEEILNGTHESIGEDMSNVSSKTDSNANIEIVEGEKTKKRKIPNIFALLITCIFIVAGGGLLYLGFTSVAQQMSYVETEATVISIRTYEKKDDGNTILMVVPTYEYYANGVRYVVESKTASSANIAPIVGDVITIKYNPDNPKEIVTMAWSVILVFVMGAAFVILGGTAFVLVIKGKLK